MKPPLFTTITDHHWKVSIPMARARRRERQGELDQQLAAALAAIKQRSQTTIYVCGGGPDGLQPLQMQPGSIRPLILDEMERGDR